MVGKKTLREAVAELESSMIRETLRETAGRVAPASRILGIPLSSLWAKIKKYRIDVGAYDPEGYRGLEHVLEQYRSALVEPSKTMRQRQIAAADREWAALKPHVDELSRVLKGAQITSALWGTDSGSEKGAEHAMGSRRLLELISMVSELHERCHKPQGGRK
jgi:hypothetical protein